MENRDVYFLLYSHIFSTVPQKSPGAFALLKVIFSFNASKNLGKEVLLSGLGPLFCVPVLFICLFQCDQSVVPVFLITFLEYLQNNLFSAFFFDPSIFWCVFFDGQKPIFMLFEYQTENHVYSRKQEIYFSVIKRTLCFCFVEYSVLYLHFFIGEMFFVSFILLNSPTFTV